MTKKILIIGSGGREHAVCEAFLSSPQSPEIFVLPGNGGTSEIATNISQISMSDHEKIIDFCKKNKIDLVFVGPEQPLVSGLVDELQKNEIRVFGPQKKAAALEGSKIFMKNFAKENQIPTAKYDVFEDASSALNFIKKIDFPCVIKADGLAAGKGVVIAKDHDMAESSILEMLAGKFGSASKKIVIEDYLDGFEVSYFVICDGKNFLPLGFAHDHKKVGEGESGVNTGGMGTFSPSPFISQELESKIINEIIEPTIEGLRSAGIEFIGVLFAGLMICKGQPKLLEFNVRFGDPETQVLLPRIKSDFLALIEAAIDGNLEELQLEIDEQKKMVCVVICAAGYPENYTKEEMIFGLDEANKIPGVRILHAGTKKSGENIVSNGGRVLNVVASAKDFELARKNAYRAVDLIDWKGGFCRRDIAKSATKQEK